MILYKTVMSQYQVPITDMTNNRAKLIKSKKKMYLKKNKNNRSNS